MSQKSLKVQKSPNRPTTINYHFTQRIILHFVPFLGNFPDTFTKKVLQRFDKKMLASPRLPNKSHNTGIFIANKGISNHNKDNGKAMLKNWTKGGWKAGTWPVHRGRPSPISAAISFDSILSSGIDIHPSSRTISPQAVHSVRCCLICICLNYWKLWVC